MTGSPTRVATSCTNASCSLGRQALQVGAQDDRAQIGLERLAGLEAGRLVGQPALEIDEPGRVQPAGRGQDASRSGPVPSQPSPMPASARLDARDVADAAALGDEPAARPQDRGEVPEQGVVVGHPVEGRGRQDGVDRLGHRQRPAQVGDDVLDPVAEAGQPLARRVDHRRRAVEGHDRAAVGTHPLEERLGDPAAAAARVEDAARRRRSGSRSRTVVPQRVIGSATRS